MIPLCNSRHDAISFSIHHVMSLSLCLTSCNRPISPVTLSLGRPWTDKLRSVCSPSRLSHESGAGASLRRKEMTTGRSLNGRAPSRLALRKIQSNPGVSGRLMAAIIHTLLKVLVHVSVWMCGWRRRNRCCLYGGRAADKSLNDKMV